MNNFDPNNLGHIIDGHFIRETGTAIYQHLNTDNDMSSITIDNVPTYYIDSSAYMYKYESDGTSKIIGKFNYVSQDRGNTWDYSKLEDGKYTKVYTGTDRHVENLLHEELRVAILLHENKL